MGAKGTKGTKDDKESENGSRDIESASQTSRRGIPQGCSSFQPFPQFPICPPVLSGLRDLRDLCGVPTSFAAISTFERRSDRGEGAGAGIARLAVRPGTG
jgi:hypothetical protein